jgi:hypothetical protein
MKVLNFLKFAAIALLAVIAFQATAQVTYIVPQTQLKPQATGSVFVLETVSATGKWAVVAKTASLTGVTNVATDMVTLTQTGTTIGAAISGVAAATVGQVPSKGAAGVVWLTPSTTNYAFTFRIPSTTAGATATLTGVSAVADNDVHVKRNGIELYGGAGNDWTRAGAVFTFAEPLIAGEQLVVYERK